jgi:twitching motility protein PilI
MSGARDASAMDGVKQSGKLREFSSQLAERLKAAPQRPDEPTRLAVRIGREAFLVEMALAAEIVPLSEVTPVPWTRPWYRGLTNVRGRLVGVVDLLEFAGRGRMPTETAQQLLVFNESLKVNAALIITRAFGIRNLKDLELVGAASAADGARAWEHDRYRDMDGTVLTELDLRLLAATDAFVAIGV